MGAETLILEDQLGLEQAADINYGIGKRPHITYLKAAYSESLEPVNSFPENFIQSTADIGALSCQ